jgi:N-acetylglucosaminyldiphosphoundecaprenol N-acetyl-beta-D-mannosaminyltransferase
MTASDVAESTIERLARKDFLGVPIDCLTLAETIAAIDQAIQRRQCLQHVCINVAKFVAMRTNRELEHDVLSSDIISADGMGIVWAARFMGVDVPERVPGIDLMEGVIALCAAKGYRPYCLGATEDVLKAASVNMQRRFPGLILAGIQHGYFKAAEEPEIIAAIRNSKADCLFIGMPTPRKEELLARFHDAFGVPFIMGVGGAFDVFAGRVRRAPQLVQKVGLEWFFRTVQEPVRLGPRYLTTNAAFVGIIAKALAARLRSKSTSSK